MREILFRGKSGATGNWVYGDLYTRYCSIYHNGEKIAIDEETIGEYTGLKDKNGIRVFEGDIIKTTKGQYVVTFQDGMFFATINSKKRIGGYALWTFTLHEEDNTCEVIGNIHDRR